MTTAFSWQNSIFAFALLHSIFQGQICLLPQVFLDFLLLHSSPLSTSQCVHLRTNYWAYSLTSLCSFLWSLFLKVTPFLRWGLFPVLVAWTHKDYLWLNSYCICIRQSLFAAWPCKLLTLATWCKEAAHWKRPWCWERLRAGGEGGNRGWDGWLATSTQWTWVEQTPGESEGQGSLLCCSPWGHKESGMT